MTVTKSGTPIGDWRSGAHGGNRRAHLFVFHIMETNKRAACGARVSRPGRVNVRETRDLCYECLTYGASGR